MAIMIKLCIVTSVHQPFDVRMFHKVVESLAAAGHDVTIIAQRERGEILFYPAPSHTIA